VAQSLQSFHTFSLPSQCQHFYQIDEVNSQLLEVERHKSESLVDSLIEGLIAQLNTLPNKLTNHLPLMLSDSIVHFRVIFPGGAKMFFGSYVLLEYKLDSTKYLKIKDSLTSVAHKIYNSSDTCLLNHITNLCEPTSLLTMDVFFTDANFH